MSLSSRIRTYSEVLRFTPFDASNEFGRSKERYRLIAISGISGVAAKLFAALTNLLSVPLAIHYLGKEQFGLWMVVSSLVAWMQLADFGIANGLTNALAEAHGRDDQGAASGYVSASVAATMVLAALCLAPVFLLASWLPWEVIMSLPKGELAPLAGRCFLVAGVVFVVNIPLSVASRVLIAYQRGYLAGITQIWSALASLVGLFIAISLKLDMVWLVLLASSGPLVGNVIAWAILVRTLPWMRFSWRLINQQAIRRVATSSIPLFLLQIGALSVNQLVNVVIANVGTLKMVADYNVIIRVYILIYVVGISLSAPFYPAIREAYERREETWVVKALKSVLLVRLGALMPAGICLFFTGDLIIRMWINVPLEESFGVIGWLGFIFSLVLAATSSTLGEVLIILDDIWPQTKLVFVSAVTVIVTMFTLIPHVGVAGVFLAMSISTLYPILWSWHRLNAKLQGRFSW